MFFNQETDSLITAYSPILLVVVITLYLLLFKPSRYFSKYFRLFYCFEVGLIMVSLFYSVFVPLPSDLFYFTIFLPLLSAPFIISLIVRVDNDMFIKGVACVFILLFIYYFKPFFYGFLQSGYDVTNASYTLLYLLPLVLCSKSKLLRFFFILLTIISVMFSLKRGCILSLSIGLFTYVYVLLFKVAKQKYNLLNILFISICIFAFIQVFLFFNSFSDNAIIDRFNSIQDDKGSGRIDVYKHTFVMFVSSNPLELLFGHGWNAVVADSELKLSAHNDHLEILYDFGLIIYALYLVVYIQLIKYTIYLVKKRSDYAPPMAMSMMIFTISSCISHIVIYNYYLLTFVIIWSFIVVSDNKQNFELKRIH